MTTSPSIRVATPDDAEELAGLTTALGYAVAADALSVRLGALLAEPSSLLLVAVDDEDRAIGWLHLELRLTLTNPPSVLIAGLVVDEAHRSEGVGAELLHAGEAWAREQGVTRMTLYSRQIRERAHRFYEREGYTIAKRSFFFEKSLE